MQTTILYDELKRVSEWIKFADTKAAFIGTIYLAASSGLYVIKETLLYSHIGGAILFYFSFFIISMGFILVMLAILPRRKNKLTKVSLLYYESVEKMQPKEFLDQLLILNDQDFQIHIIEQIYTNSKIATRKMGYVEYAIINLALLLIIGFLFLILK